jgi:hypothetical protein
MIAVENDNLLVIFGVDETDAVALLEKDGSRLTGQCLHTQYAGAKSPSRGCKQEPIGSDLRTTKTVAGERERSTAFLS